MSQSVVDSVRFSEQGLVPAIIQDAESHAVLMLGYMNADSLAQTIETGRVVFWSRSRQELWRKGDTSGHIQLVRSLSLDCDRDTVLIAVEQVGPACHNGTRTCFDAGHTHAKTDVSVEDVL